MSTAAIATGPYLRTANQCQISPEMTPPTTQIRQYHPSAAMKALVSELTTSATPWPTITSGALGAATAHRKPPATPSSTPLTSTARDVTSARRHSPAAAGGAGREPPPPLAGRRCRVRQEAPDRQQGGIGRRAVAGPISVGRIRESHGLGHPPQKRT